MKTAGTTALIAAIGSLFAFVILTGAHAASATTAKSHCAKYASGSVYGDQDAAQQQINVTALSCRKNAPWVLTIHGGAWNSGDYSGVNNAVAGFYAHGWQVFNLDYRLFSSTVTWADQENDLRTATAWIHAHAAHFGIDPAKGAVYGFSAGGQMAAWLGSQPRLGFRAVVSASGVLQPMRVCEAADGLKGPAEPATASNQSLCGKEIAMMGCAAPVTAPPPDPATDDPAADLACQQAWADFSPQTQLTAGSARVFAVQGTTDPDIPAGTADAYTYWAGRARVTHKAVDVPGCVHTSECLWQHASTVRAMYQFVAAANAAARH